MAQRYGWTLDYIRDIDLDDVAKLMVVWKEETDQADKRKRAMDRKLKKSGAS